jgi:hypothetical protein
MRTEATFLYKYNDEMQQFDSMKLDNSYIPFEIQKGLLPSTGTITKDSLILEVLIGPEVDDYDSLKYSVFVKWDIQGKYLWSKKIEFEGYNKTFITKIIESANGYYTTFGSTWNAKKMYFFMAKITYDGEILMQTIFPTAHYQHLNGYKELQGGKYYISYGDTALKFDHTASQFWFSIINNSGEELQKYIWDINGQNEIFGVAEKENGNLVIYGKHGYDSVYLAEIEFPTLTVDGKIIKENEFYEIYPNPITNNNEININFNQ